MSRGVCLGTSAPTQKSKSESGKPDSSVVGTCGNAEARLALLTANAVSLPSLMKGSAARIGQIDPTRQNLRERLGRAFERHQLALEPRSKPKPLGGQKRRRANT